MLFYNRPKKNCYYSTEQFKIKKIFKSIGLHYLVENFYLLSNLSIGSVLQRYGTEQVLIACKFAVAKQKKYLI